MYNKIIKSFSIFLSVSSSMNAPALVHIFFYTVPSKLNTSSKVKYWYSPTSMSDFITDQKKKYYKCKNFALFHASFVSRKGLKCIDIYLILLHNYMLKRFGFFWKKFLAKDLENHPLYFRCDNFCDAKIYIFGIFEEYVYIKTIKRS